MPKTIRRIGASKLATVSECQTAQGKPIALKEFNRQSLTPLQRERIFSAAQRWKKLTLPGLVRYWDVSAEQLQLTMELLDRSVAIRLREGPSDPRLVLHTVRGVLSVLALLHEQGLLHANLKPSNVFFDTDGRVRLSDGLLIDVRLPVALPPPMNLKYTAPEQTHGEFGPLTPATDLYCVGLMALEMLAGDRFARAFQGIRSDAPEEDMAWSQWHGSSLVAPSATLFAKGCPDELANVIARMLSKQPSMRYTTVRQAIQDLPNDLTDQTTSATPERPAVAEKKQEPLAAHVIPRPATGVVLAIASGPRAGEMLGSNENELMIGFDHDCFLRFSPDLCPVGGSKVLMRRGPQGWYALRVAGDAAFVNQRALEDKCPLRSGDIVRLSSRGPDVQFTMQSGGVAIRSLVERFLPSQGQRPLSPQGLAAAATAAAAAVGPRGTVVSPPSREPVAGAAAHSTAPGTSLGTSASGTPSGSSPTTGSPGSRLPLQPLAPQPTKPLVPTKPTQPALATAVPGTTSKFSWRDPRTWNALMWTVMLVTLWAVLVLIVAGLLALVFTAWQPSEAPPSGEVLNNVSTSENATDVEPAQLEPAELPTASSEK